MNAYIPHPALVDKLCGTYGMHHREDIVACLKNAHLAWRNVSPEAIDTVPELVTARAFRVRSVYARTSDERAWANYCESLILEPYRTR